MERQQKEMDETSDRHYDLMNNGNGGGPSAYDAYSASTGGGGVGLARMASLNNNARNTPTLLNREVSGIFLEEWNFELVSRILGT